MGVSYFASDFHLGAPDKQTSLDREKSIVAWLEYTAHDATDIYLVGDVFDFWFEYKKVIPKGYSRLFGKIAQLSDQGIQFHFFHGNHDMWVNDYFREEFNMILYPEPISLDLHGKKIFVGHGDGLGPGDRGYKIIKQILRSRFCQWAFARFHPNFGVSLAEFLSGKSRQGQGNEHLFLGVEKEWLYLFSCAHQQKTPHDFYFFGHRHLPMRLDIPGGTYINLGEWIHYNTFIKMASETPQFLQWTGTKAIPYETKHAT